MVSIMEQMTFFIGRAICHQLPERSFQMKGHYFPVCARDAGIYLGIFSSLMFITLLKRYRNITIPNKKHSFILLFFLLPLLFDGFGSYLGVYSTTNFIRTATGVLFGITLPFFLIPLISTHSSEKKAIPIIKNTYEIFIPLLFACTTLYFASLSLESFFIIQLLIIGTLVVWITLFFYLFYRRFRNRFLAICFSLMSCLIALSFLSYTHSFIRPFYLQNL